MANANGTRRDDERASLGQLVASLADNVSSLVRDEIALAKAEMQESGKRFATGGGLLAGALGLLVMVFLLITFAIVYGLTDGTGLPLWASFLIVGLVYLLIALILAFAGKKQMEKARGPEKANEAANETKQILTGLVPKQATPDPVATGPAAGATGAPTASTAPRPPDSPASPGAGVGTPPATPGS